ncbi:phospho-N-acetylmuramoyl-pentapeptide-transferase [Peptoanaerobacter stomatis]|uniref:phospho-N-acetylmuramoyl-pentapeptide- transferase n=1 Tax=Peptoanaerobacter stomatis TaxID=796937 RepID=UPI003FA09A5C
MLPTSQIIEYILSFLFAFAIAFVISPKILDMLKKLKLGQEIRQEGPQSHLSKAGTPTMGGIVFIIAIVISSLVLNRNNIFDVLVFLAYLLLFAIIGFTDDYVKIVNKRNLGLTEKQKLLVQLVFAIILSYISLVKSSYNTDLVVPFTSFKLHTGFLYIPLTSLVIIATTNSVNLTDGLDGLASSVTSIVMLAFAIIAINLNYITTAMISLSVAGACLGFLRINAHPAKSFMGDTGSMALGGAVSAIAIAMNMHLIIIIIGIIYVIESLSVIIQVYSFKHYGKRVFKMSPFHHHMELSGYKEVQVVKIFCIITCIASIIGIISTAFI